MLRCRTDQHILDFPSCHRIAMNVPTVQKALHLTARAGPYEVVNIEVPKLDAGEVLIRIEATALNPGDWKVRFLPQFAGLIKEYPVIQGMDAAGVIVALGDGVIKHRIGDKV
ncbi:hypothetical protein EIP91_005229 [Steccherinum ochraceum]|uniref:Alcohol dehydrogenase-like N-terminal domain-containing protein n=1 Tax=Steccherinum ochraceum TaxID=92696 RepID=A0A4R0RIF3_9APHY|nr:hypothetical protein EIP91_005229 [Steccherinum ochraceum]